MTASGAVLRSILREHRRALLAGAGAGSAWMAAAAAVPVVVSRAVDDGVVAGDRAALLGWLVALAGVTAIQLLAGAARHWLACALHYGATSSVSRRVTARVHDPRGGVDRAPGELVSLITSDAARMGAVADLCCRGTGAVVAVVGVGALMLATAPVLAASVLVAIPVLLGVSAPLLGPLERRTRLEQHARAGLASSTTDLVSGLRVLHGLGAVRSARAAFDVRNQDARRRAVEAGRVQAGWEAVAVIVPGALLAVIVAVGHRLVVDGTLSIGELVGFLALGQFLLVPVATLVEVGDVWTRGLASARRAAQLLDAEPAVADTTDSSAGPPSLTAGGPALEITDVADAGVLDGCRLAVEWGEVVAVATADDRVATLIAELAARDRDPDRGTILAGGVDARRWPLSALRLAVLVATGDGLLVDGTLAHNVAFGRSGHDGQHDAVVRQAMAVAALDDVVAALPDGAGSPVGERGRFLSGGQRQRIGLARALAAEPPVLVLVDPTSAVDAHTENAIARSVVRARRAAGMATVLITTSPTLLAAADRVVHIHGGRVAGAGTHLELVASCSTYRSIVIADPASEPPA